MKKLLTFLFLFVITTYLFAQTSTAPSGSGTAGDPYQISNLNNLYWLTQTTSAWAAGTYFVQTADIDASSTSSWASGQGFSPIGNYTTKFYGNYNGGGYTIDGLFINRTSTYYVGLFGYTQAAEISNLGVTNANITSPGYSGCLVGINYTNSTLTNCYATGSNTATTHGNCGLLVGNNYGTIEYCHVKDGSVTGNASAPFGVGGLVGVNNGGGVIRHSYSNCTVYTPSQQAGGFVGRNGYGGDATIENCYSLGHTTGSTYSGGFCGLNQGGSITNCYNAGLFTYTGSQPNSAGGFCGSNSATISQCFWDTETSYPTSVGGTGKTTAEMQTLSTFTDAGWDCSNCWQITGTNYPDLKNNSNSALPVELTTFTVNISENAVELNWQTATEVNNYGFDVESKADNGAWKKLGFVNGHGNSNSPKYYSFSDSRINISGKNFYRLKQIDIDGQFEYSDEVEVILNTPADFELSQNYPNPFNPTTSISYSIPKDGNVALGIYDILGNEVAVLENGYKSAGSYSQSFNASNLTSGLYFYTIRTDDFSITKKMLLMK